MINGWVNSSYGTWSMLDWTLWYLMFFSVRSFGTSVNKAVNINHVPHMCLYFQGYFHNSNSAHQIPLPFARRSHISVHRNNPENNPGSPCFGIRIGKGGGTTICHLFWLDYLWLVVVVWYLGFAECWNSISPFILHCSFGLLDRKKPSDVE